MKEDRLLKYLSATALFISACGNVAMIVLAVQGLQRLDLIANQLTQTSGNIEQFAQVVQQTHEDVAFGNVVLSRFWRSFEDLKAQAGARD
jgi:hypothetical protein